MKLFDIDLVHAVPWGKFPWYKNCSRAKFTPTLIDKVQIDRGLADLQNNWRVDLPSAHQFLKKKFPF